MYRKRRDSDWKALKTSYLILSIFPSFLEVSKRLVGMFPTPSSLILCVLSVENRVEAHKYGP